MNDKYFTLAALQELQSSKDFEFFSHTDILDLLNNLRQRMKSTSSHLNFDVSSPLTEENYKDLTGLTKENFSDMVQHLSTVRNTGNRSVRTCLGIFLMKLRVGLANKILATIFGLKTTHVQRIIHAVRRTLMETFVPHTVGFQHINHDDMATSHTTPIAQKLFTTQPGQAVVVLDGTYVFIQKSQDYRFQRMSFSMHNHRPLVKPMVIVGTDGYILSVLGPYFSDGHNNDAAITQHAITNNVENMASWFRKDDVFLVDRGFKDAVKFLEDSGYMVKMSICLPKGSKQLSTKDANLTRLVTKCRWVVERTNARIKHFRFFDKIVPNSMIPSIGDLVKIICGLLNKYKGALLHHPEDDEVAKKMLERSLMENPLKLFVEENNLARRRSAYRKLDGESLQDFPRLSLDILRSITLGVYQIKQAPNYAREHISEEGNFDLLVCKESESLLQVKIQSRHTKAAVHTLWIDYSCGTDLPIKGWYCTCKVGARMVGCCAHIASVLWYLGIERHDKVLKPSRLSSTATVFHCREHET
ncbi:uncharacterized protein LOC134270728 [Saccostrea cucullata]|uniref:uncharacterized protein LOC134270728 n=1 Tax=Saccostrea cuccullata TaxID=36930 RepID=UPI002ED01A99